MTPQLTQEEIIAKTEAYVRQQLANAEGGHDWWHIHRVWKLSRRIAEAESVDMLVVELAALLHDIADAKFHEGDETIGPRRAARFLTDLGVGKEIVIHVKSIIENISFKGGNFNREFHSNELDVVQDADRLDAIGAIGIARAFNYGGFKNRPMYDPDIQPKPGMTKEEYKKTRPLPSITSTRNYCSLKTV